MKHFGLLGEHLGHSLSPVIHNTIFKQNHIDAVYELIECSENELKAYLEALKKGDYAGFNVTIPYKKTILSLLDEVDEKAQKIGSVNTVYLKNGKCVGTNTDYDGFLATIKRNDILVKNQDCYILGTGGASLAIYHALKDLGGHCIYVSRTPKEGQIGYQELAAKRIDLLVNTTPVGMYPNSNQSPVSKEIASQAKTVIDIIFNPERTQLLMDAGSAINGLYMLLMQAIKAEEIWQNKQLNIQEEELLEIARFYLSLPKDIYSYVQNLSFQEDKTGRSEDRVYLFEKQYVLKISKNKDDLKKEKEKVDWLSDKISGSKSICYQEVDGNAYYLRTLVQGDSLISKRFLDQPELLIRTIKNVVDILRGLDQESCPFQASDSIGTYFVHGDLCLPNIFVDEDNHFSGLIDLSGAGLGDPWYDYAWLLWSFEYNLKTNQFNQKLLDALGIEFNEEAYSRYIPVEYRLGNH